MFFFQETRSNKVNPLLDDHIGCVAARIHELKALEKELRTLRGQCQDDQGKGDFAILEKLSTSALEPARSRRKLHVLGAHS